MTYESSKKFFLNYCQHFPVGGVRNSICNLGIEFKSVRSQSKLPCLVSDNCSERCSSFQPRTEADAEAYAERSESMLQLVMERLNSNQCPHCGTEVQERVQVDRCVYAKPCNHRIGQGKA